MKKFKKSTFPYEFFLHRKILNDFWFSQFSFINLSFNLLLYNILLMQKRFNIHIFYLNFPSYKKKCVPDRFSRFDVYQFQTNKQTSKQSIYIELVFSFGGTHVLCTYIVYMYYVRTLNTCTMYVHCIHVLCTYILYMYYVRTLYTWTTFNFVKRLSRPTLISVLLSYVCHCHKFFLFYDFHVHVVCATLVL